MIVDFWLRFGIALSLLSLKSLLSLSVVLILENGSEKLHSNGFGLLGTLCFFLWGGGSGSILKATPHLQ